MRLFKLFLFGLFLVAFWSCSDLGEPVADCPDGQAEDCAGVCGGTAVEDCTGECGGTNQDCVSYSSEIQLIFSANCIGCHNDGNSPSGGLKLTSWANLMAGGVSGQVVQSGNSSNSRLIQKLRGTASGDQMPQYGTPLEESIISTIETWINEGAQNN